MKAKYLKAALKRYREVYPNDKRNTRQMSSDIVHAIVRYARVLAGSKDGGWHLKGGAR